MMKFQLPNINEMTTVEAIHWYTQEIAEVFSVRNRINGTYSDAYKDALLAFKQELNRKSLADKNLLIQK